MSEGFYSSPFWAGYLETQRSRLPELQDIDDGLSNCVVRFLGCNPGSMQLQGTNTYLVGTGCTRILIDTGEGAPQWALNVTRYLEDHDISISHVLLTHWHGDHTGGVYDLLAHDPSIKIYKQMPSQGQCNITDGEIFRVHGATLRAVATPGHTSDHMCFVLEEENALFTGDNVLGHGYSIAEDLESYTSTLRLMSSLQCATGYPGHGDVILHLTQTLSKYIAQRVSRERQIYSVLASQTTSDDSSRGSSSANSIRSIRNNSTPYLNYSADSDMDNCEASEAAASTGLTTAEIGNLLYGNISEDSHAFNSAIGPLLNQVLYMLLEQGKVGSKVVGPNDTRCWFADV